MYTKPTQFGRVSDAQLPSQPVEKWNTGGDSGSSLSYLIHMLFQRLISWACKINSDVTTILEDGKASVMPAGHWRYRVKGTEVSLMPGLLDDDDDGRRSQNIRRACRRSDDVWSVTREAKTMSAGQAPFPFLQMLV